MPFAHPTKPNLHLFFVSLVSFTGQLYRQDGCNNKVIAFLVNNEANTLFIMPINSNFVIRHLHDHN